VALTLHWREDAPYGPSVEYLLNAEDMAAVRAVSERARLYWGPPDRGSQLAAKHPLKDVAQDHPGELLWRLEGELEWRVGAESVAAWRDADIERFNSTRDAAKGRRRQRRG